MDWRGRNRKIGSSLTPGEGERRRWRRQDKWRRRCSGNASSMTESVSSQCVQLICIVCWLIVQCI